MDSNPSIPQQLNSLEDDLPPIIAKDNPDWLLELSKAKKERDKYHGKVKRQGLLLLSLLGGVQDLLKHLVPSCQR